MVTEKISNNVPGEIESAISVDGFIVVLFKDENETDANIWAVNQDGTVEWKAEPTGGSGSENPYVNIWLDGDELWAGAWKGMDYRLDIGTGNHIEKKYTK